MSRSRKILQINPSSELGGGSQVMWDIVRELRGSFKFKVLIPEGEFLEKYKSEAISARILTGSFLKKIKIIREQIRKEESSIVHVHGTRAAFWTRFAVIGLKNKPKVVYTLHGFHLVRRPFLVKWPLLLAEKFLNQWTDVLVCVSKADRELVKEYGVIARDQIEVIKNGIDIPEFKVAEGKIKKEKENLNIENSFIITSIARLHPQKDVSTLLGGFKRIIEQVGDSIKLLIVGSGPLRGKLEQKVKDLNLSEHVKFLGFRKDTSLLINLSDLIVLSTNWEGLPLVPLEAETSRKPVVGSNVGGVRETIQDGETGFLFKKNSEKDLADKMLELYKSEGLRDKMGKSGYQFVQRNYSKKRMVKEYKQLYEELL